MKVKQTKCIFVVKIGTLTKFNYRSVFCYYEKLGSVPKSLSHKILILQLI